LLSNERTADSSKERRVRFDLQEFGRRGQEEPRRKAGERKLSTADDSECDDSASQNTKSDSNRFAATEHTTVQESVSKRKSMTGLGPSRTVTRYDADSSEADIEFEIDEMNPERDGADASAGHDTFVAHQWGRKETPAKRIRTPRHSN
jgi:hypothetical protein